MTALCSDARQGSLAGPSRHKRSRHERIVEVVHEALIQRWERLRGWMEADRAFRRWQEGLQASLRQWEKSDWDEGALLHGAPLIQAESWLAARSEELSATEAEFIAASIALRERRAAEREVLRQRELATERSGAACWPCWLACWPLLQSLHWR